MTETLEFAALVLLVGATLAVAGLWGVVKYRSWQERRRIKTHFRSKG